MFSLSVGKVFDELITEGIFLREVKKDNHLMAARGFESDLVASDSEKLGAKQASTASVSSSE